jgi:hypothetical protein
VVAARGERCLIRHHGSMTDAGRVLSRWLIASMLLAVLGGVVGCSGASRHAADSLSAGLLHERLCCQTFDRAITVLHRGRWAPDGGTGDSERTLGVRVAQPAVGRSAGGLPADGKYRARGSNGPVASAAGGVGHGPDP